MEGEFLLDNIKAYMETELEDSDTPCLERATGEYNAKKLAELAVVEYSICTVEDCGTSQYLCDACQEVYDMALELVLALEKEAEDLYAEQESNYRKGLGV